MITRNDSTSLHTNKVCREVFHKPADLNLPEEINPDNPEKQNDWILDMQGILLFYHIILTVRVHERAKALTP